MLELPHTLAGTAIAVKIRQPLLALPAALVSHYVLDFIPHWDPSINIFNFASLFLLTVDFSLAIAAGIFFTYHFRSHLVIFCIALAVLPDIISIPYFLFHQPAFVGLLMRWQAPIHNNVSFLPGIITQIAVSGYCLYITLKILIGTKTGPGKTKLFGNLKQKLISRR